jgi:outer membrane lipoprotein-sorting protein
MKNGKMTAVRAVSVVFAAALVGGVAAPLTATSARIASGAARPVPQPLTAAQILKKIDDNRVTDNKIIVSEMVIHGRRESRSVKSKSWIEGVTRSFTEYLEPARDKGTKMLKLANELWTYTPSTDRTIKISGNLLRQSVMGSDLSYEDMMEDPLLSHLYEARIDREDVFENRPCWVLGLSAKKEDVAYYTRTVWVDRERFVILKEEMYARSGKLLKTLEVKSVRWIAERWVQDKVVYRDVMKTGDGTEFNIESIEFNAAIPDYVFSKASLRR